MSRHARIWFTAVTLGVAASMLLLTLEALAQPCAIDGFYFQLWSSETMMQTVSLRDLRQAPWESLANVHIQPPLFDAFRALLAANIDTDQIDQTVKAVDGALYFSWILAYGAMAALLYLWLKQLTSHRFAVPAAMLFALHPAALFYATMLDTTFVSSLLILWFYYLLWRLSHADDKAGGLFWLLAVVALLLFFTRSVFQWPWILLLGITLLLIGLPKRKILLFLLVVGGASGVYLGKQYLQFGLLGTSSFAGSNLTRSVGIADDQAYWKHLGHQGMGASPGAPGVLSRKVKVTGTPNFNHSAYLDLHRQLLNKYHAYLATAPLSELLVNYWDNLRIWLSPSSRYTEHRIVDRLPWRTLYDRLFSHLWLVGLLCLAIIHWALFRCQKHRTWRDTGLLLPLLFIFFVTVLFEKGENMRLKFLIEPLLYLFVMVQMYHFGMRIVDLISHPKYLSDQGNCQTYPAQCAGKDPARVSLAWRL